MQITGTVREYVQVEPDNQQTSILSLRVHDVSPEAQAEIEELRSLLHLNPKATEFKLVYGSVPADDTEIAVQTRSLVDLIINLPRR